MPNLTSTFTTTVQNRTIIELRYIADHCVYMTAWLQHSWSFDPSIRNGGAIKVPSCALARPVNNQNV